MGRVCRLVVGVTTAEKEIIERSRVRQQCPISEFGGCCSPSVVLSSGGETF